MWWCDGGLAGCGEMDVGRGKEERLIVGTRRRSVKQCAWSVDGLILQDATPMALDCTIGS